MLTNREMQVIQSAISQWNGVYNRPPQSDSEKARHNEMMLVANNLLDRVEEILQYQSEIESYAKQYNSSTQRFGGYNL